MNWFEVKNIDEIDTPALLIFKERVRENIKAAVEAIDDIEYFRPHVKTNKIAEVCQLLQNAGIRKFKCATIAEAEMLAMIGAEDVLLAYQPTETKAKRFLQLVRQFPETQFSCLVDNEISAEKLNSIFTETHKAQVYIDLNTGMNRTGIKPENAFDLFRFIQFLPNLAFKGLHFYDGHVHHPSIEVRKTDLLKSHQSVFKLVNQIQGLQNKPIKVVAGGTNTFMLYEKNTIEYSPGTFVFWDWGYSKKYSEQPFQFAAVLATRVISIIDSELFTVDLGHKSVAAENPLPRVLFLNLPDCEQVNQSEEHLVLKVNDTSNIKIGDVFYAVPLHICPTVALYDTVQVVENQLITKNWKVVARNRSLTI